MKLIPIDLESSSEAQQYPGLALTIKRVERDQTVKGYEVGRGRHVVLTEEELEALQRRREPTIEIEEFVPLDQVDPVSLDHSGAATQTRCRGRLLRCTWIPANLS